MGSGDCEMGLAVEAPYEAVEGAEHGEIGEW